MALDRERILNELGSVMNQLQSVNCGCLGNLFEKSAPNTQCLSQGHAPSTCGGHHHNCGHGHGPTVTRDSCGESYSINNQPHNHCTSASNPPKFFTDTQNYLNTNIVQPIVKEVYEELKTITPENTIVNSPLANQMGLPYPCVMQQGDRQGLVQNNLPKQFHSAKPPITQNSMENTNNPLQSIPFSVPRTQMSLNQTNNNTVTSNNQQMLNPTQSSYGQHAQGMAKFKEMFPGVMGQGDLGFDPMEIAIQMNPANQQKAAMDITHTKCNEVNKPFNSYEPSTLHPSQQQNVPQVLNHNSTAKTYTCANHMPVTDLNVNSIPQNTSNNAFCNQLPSRAQACNNGLMNHIDHHVTPGQPVIQNYVTNDQTNHIQQQQSHLPTISEMSNLSPNDQKDQPITQTTTDSGNCKQLSNAPMLPVDSCMCQSHVQKTPQSYEYNTLGQPVEILPASVYRTPEVTLPQTLSPQPVHTSNNALYSNVKSTLSKTSISGNKPIGKTPSRSRLQRMYDEYKGSQSFLPQNTCHRLTHSDGKLSDHNSNEKNSNNFTIERTGGDTMLNNDIVQKIEAVGQIGDVSATNKPDNSVEKLSLNINRKSRNGLQDIVYTSYPTSTAWSFHGIGQPAFTAGHRSRN